MKMKWLKNNRAFTLVEMMVVLFIISILLMITIPNVTANQEAISNKGCEAIMNMVQSQVQAYTLEKGKPPTNIDDLVTEKYFEKNPTCPDGRTVIIENGKVVKDDDPEENS